MEKIGLFLGVLFNFRGSAQFPESPCEPGMRSEVLLQCPWPFSDPWRQRVCIQIPDYSFNLNLWKGSFLAAVWDVLCNLCGSFYEVLISFSLAFLKKVVGRREWPSGTWEQNLTWIGLSISSSTYVLSSRGKGYFLHSCAESSMKMPGFLLNKCRKGWGSTWAWVKRRCLTFSAK